MIAEWFGLDPEEFNQVDILWSGLDSPMLWLFLAATIPLSLHFFRTSLRRIGSRPKKTFILFLRITALALLAISLFQPRLEFRNNQTLKNHIAVLLDDSKSMSVKSYPDEISRTELVKKWLGRNMKTIESWTRDYKVEFFFASDALSPASIKQLPDQLNAKKPRTDFERVFTNLNKRYEGKSLQGVVFVSDGADRSQSEGELSSGFLEALSSMEGPVHTFLAGDRDGFKDLSIQHIAAARFGFLNQPSRVIATISAVNMGNKNISLTLKEEGKILASKLIQLKEGRTQYQVELEFVPAALGKKNYLLTLPVFTGEAISENNRKDFQVKSVRDRIRILHLNGRPSWDSRFLREALASNPKTDLLSFFILRTLNDDVSASTSELSLIPFPSNLLFTDYLDSFDLVIFQNFRYEPFISKRYLSNISKYVEKGGAFLMIGGELSFQMGDYDRSPIEDILPVQMAPIANGYLNDEFKIKINEQYKAHPALSLDNNLEKNKALWSEMTPLNGINSGLTAKPTAQTIAEYQGANGKSLPLLTVWSKGKGRTMALATDSSWNWNFIKAGEGGSGRHYYKFWGQLISWAIGEPETQTLRIAMDKEQYQENEEVLLKLSSLKDDYNPSPGEEIEIEITPPNGKKFEFKSETTENGSLDLHYQPESAGYYTVKVKRKNSDKDKLINTGFSVASDDSEFYNAQANPELLKKISDSTGGRFNSIDSNFDLKELAFPNPKKFAHLNSKTISSWNNWWLYSLLTGLLVLEWLIRRKSGLS